MNVLSQVNGTLARSVTIVTKGDSAPRAVPKLAHPVDPGQIDDSASED